MSETSTTTSTITTPPSRGLFGTKIPASAAFAVGVLLFLMPFIDIKCDTISIAKLSGVELATGYRIKSPGGDNSMLGKLENTNLGGETVSKKNDKKDVNMYALAALILGAIGLLLSLLNARAGILGGLLTGLLAAVSLIVLMIDVKNQISKETGSGELNPGAVIRVDFTPAFYLAVIAFLAAAFFSYKRKKSM